MTEAKWLTCEDPRLMLRLLELKASVEGVIEGMLAARAPARRGEDDAPQLASSMQGLVEMMRGSLIGDIMQAHSLSSGSNPRGPSSAEILAEIQQRITFVAPGDERGFGFDPFQVPGDPPISAGLSRRL